MKKAILALAAAMTCGAAQAQSSVTLYGVADVNIEYVNKVGVVPSAANGFKCARLTDRGRTCGIDRKNDGGRVRAQARTC
ncbi:hypothetical protein LMG23992_00818 [Cupriavidus laharis]|uniref:Porin domain-containing protein n=1 Tax=Cupriavidus laharis TaxID=151654 RepID=A0ABM8WJA0_9BURK|nr:hypothetical protein LMG23992_00818 [Cupriavidus laharis]